MRISFAAQKDATLFTLGGKVEEINRLQLAISSGTSLASPADDPYAWAQGMEVKQGLREYDSILKNITHAKGWNNATEASLNGLSDLVSQAKQNAITATSPSWVDKRDGLAGEVDEILKQALAIANSQWGDTYIYGGTETSSPPFSIDDATGVVTYSGDDEHFSVRTERGGNGSSEVNLTGTEVFTYTSGTETLNILHELWELREGIKSQDSTTISEKLTTLDDAFSAISKQTAITGNRLAALEDQESAISVFKANETQTLAELVGTDLTDAIVRLQQEQTVYQAALKVTSMLDGLNLTSYL
ncbi:MAG: hypothetical protein AB9866_06030 [Syntrophobacteraceae bacterium]